MDVDEAERQHRGGQHRVELARCLPVEGDHTVDELLQIFRPGTHVAGERLLRLPVPFTDKAALVAQAERYETIVADHDALQAAQFCDVQRLFARLADSVAPALDAGLRRPFAFNREARAGIVEQQERGGPRQEIAGHRRRGVLCSRLQVEGDEAVQPFGTGHQWAEFRRAGEVVLDPMAGGIHGGGRVLALGVDHQRIGAAAGVRQVEPPVREPLVEEPDAPCVGTGRRGPDERLDGGGTAGGEQPLEHGQIDSLMLQGEGEVAVQPRRRRVGG